MVKIRQCLFYFVVLVALPVVANEKLPEFIPSDKLTNEQIDKIVEACPLLTHDEIATAYVKSRVAVEGCPGARALEVQYNKVYADFRRYKSQAGHSSYPQDSDEQIVSALHNEAAEFINRVEAVKCASNTGDYFWSLLPLVSIIAPAHSAIAGESAMLAKRIFNLFDSKKNSLAEKFQICTANTLMQKARSHACFVASYDQPFQVGESKIATFSLKDFEEKIMRRLKDRVEQSKKTNTFKFLSALNEIKTLAPQLDEKEDPKNICDKLEKHTTFVFSVLSCSENPLGRFQELCKFMAEIKNLTLKIKNFDVESFSERGTNFNKIKLLGKHIRVLEEPDEFVLGFSKDQMTTKDFDFWVANNHKSLRDEPSAIKGDTMGQADEALRDYEYTHLKGPWAAGSQGNLILDAFKNPRDSKKVISLIRESIETLPIKVSVDESTCEATACIWNTAATHVAFKKSLDEMQIETGWKFGTNQSYSTVLNSVGSKAIIERKLIETRVDVLKSLAKKCSEYADKISSCELSCLPSSSAFKWPQGTPVSKRRKMDSDVKEIDWFPSEGEANRAQ